MGDDRDDTLRETVAALQERCDRLDDRVNELEAENESLRAETDELRTDADSLRKANETLREANAALRDRVAELDDRCDPGTDCDCAGADRTDSEIRAELDRIESKADAAINRSGINRDRIAELQSRELEKGAHLRTAHVDPHAVTVAGDQLEKITRDDGHHYYRVPDSAEPLDRDGSVKLSHADLLPIQQLARMDDDMRRSTTSALPTRLAAQLWQARADPDIGDNPWETGGKRIREYVKASDLKHWIRRQESGISDVYAKKLVSRTIDAILDLSKNRLAVRKQTERKNGLAYTERRLVLPADADLPGDRPTTNSGTAQDPVTADVHG